MDQFVARQPAKTESDAERHAIRLGPETIGRLMHETARVSERLRNIMADEGVRLQSW